MNAIAPFIWPPAPEPAPAGALAFCADAEPPWIMDRDEFVELVDARANLEITPGGLVILATPELRGPSGDGTE